MVRTSRLATEGFLEVLNRAKALQSLHFSKTNLPLSVVNSRQPEEASLVELAVLVPSLQP